MIVSSDLQTLRIAYLPIFFKAKLNSELQQARNATATEAGNAAANTKAAVDAALAQQKTQGDGDPDAGARHAEELRNLEERLKKQHAEELARAVEAAKTTSGTNSDQSTIDAALAARLQDIQAKHAQEIEAAIERGRMEASTKTRLKDSQLLKAQKRLKELEAQLAQLQSGAPAPAASSKPTQPVQANPAAKVAPAATTKPPAPAQIQKPAPTAAAPRPSGLPQKPGVPPTAGRGRGGAVRGTARGGAPGLAIRGAAPAATEVSPAASSPSEGVSIMGAASKRPREEGEASGDDSLAKRLKPEGAKPVQLQRNRVGPPPPSST